MANVGPDGELPVCDVMVKLFDKAGKARQVHLTTMNEYNVH